MISGKQTIVGPVRWGMIGCGDVTEKKSAPALSLVNDSKLVAVTNRTLAKAKDYADRHGIAKVYETAAELISADTINAIYIATPPSSHHALAVEVAKAGKPLYVEKPMARTFAECTQMNTVFDAARLQLHVAYYRRALPNFRKVKSLLDNGSIGQIQTIEVRLFQSVTNSVVAESPDNWRINPAISGGGYFYDLGSHQFDLLEYLLGPICSLSGSKANTGSAYAAADTVVANWQFESGILGTGIWNFNAPKTAVSEYITISGSSGEIRFPCFSHGRISVTQHGKLKTEVLALPHHIQQPLIENVVKSLQGLAEPLSSGASAARANFWLEQVRGT